MHPYNFLRYHPHVCCRCAGFITGPPFDYVCAICQQHYCLECFPEHMLEGHKAETSEVPPQGGLFG
jgi:hypothetical protein